MVSAVFLGFGFCVGEFRVLNLLFCLYLLVVLLLMLCIVRRLSEWFEAWFIYHYLLFSVCVRVRLLLSKFRLFVFLTLAPTSDLPWLGLEI